MTTQTTWLGSVEDEPSLAGYRSAVETVLSEFLSDQERGATQPPIPLFTRCLGEFLAGGKRLRPLLCCSGWLAGGGQGSARAVTYVAAGLELFHTFALIHDDIMDRSDTRRGRPTAHNVLAAQHPGHPAPGPLGVNTAILLGDLAFGWSFELVHEAGLDSSQDKVVWSLLSAMHTETLAGQYLDVVATGTPDGTVDEALAICRLKTARYSVQRPLELGAVLAGADRPALEACAAYGLALGEAFQLRDDLLGVFGDPERTGKPTLDDLRQGKPTVLVAIARQRADRGQGRRLRVLVGNPSLDETGAADARDVLVATGARAAVEAMIAERCQQALAILDDAPLCAAGVDLLRHLAVSTTSRTV